MQRSKRMAIAAIVVFPIAMQMSCGQAQDFDMGTELEGAVLGDKGGSTRTQIDPLQKAPTTTVTRTAPNYNIVNVTQIIEATSGIAGWTAADRPFTGNPVLIGANVTDGQTPISFAFNYPQNNYQFIESHLVIDTSRDNSDSEGIFVDGVLSGRPPTNMVNTTSPQITDKIYNGNGSSTVNTHFIDWSVAHYKIATRNSFDLLLSDLLTGTTKTSIDMLKDGKLNVVSGDDSPIYQAYLVIRGRTISDSALSCSQSPSFDFTNAFLHNDGNTVNKAAFSGTIGNPRQSWSQVIGTYDAVEFYYDVALPKVELANITLTKANITLSLQRDATEKAAIVINGLGIAQTGFNRANATTAVERWDEAAVPAFEAFLATVPTTGVQTDVTLNLITLLGATKVRELLSQGKLNVSLAGSQIVYALRLTSARAILMPADGPELILEGDYFTEVCTVPNNPDSALTQEGIVHKEIEETEQVGSDGEVLNDGAGPAISSLQATEITSTSATILWLTDEPAKSQVAYGAGSLNQTTPLTDQMTTFHQIKLTGLLPYKYYSFQVESTDRFGNASTSDVTIFVTLR